MQLNAIEQNIKLCNCQLQPFLKSSHDNQIAVELLEFSFSIHQLIVKMTSATFISFLILIFLNAVSSLNSEFENIKKKVFLNPEFIFKS